MFKVVKKEIEVAGKKISLETGKIARQADGAIMATLGETVVIATAVAFAAEPPCGEVLIATTGGLEYPKPSLINVIVLTPLLVVIPV